MARPLVPPAWRGRRQSGLTPDVLRCQSLETALWWCRFPYKKMTQVAASDHSFSLNKGPFKEPPHKRAKGQGWERPHLLRRRSRARSLPPETNLRAMPSSRTHHTDVTNMVAFCTRPFANKNQKKLAQTILAQVVAQVLAKQPSLS